MPKSTPIRRAAIRLRLALMRSGTRGPIKYLLKKASNPEFSEEIRESVSAGEDEDHRQYPAGGHHSHAAERGAAGAAAAQLRAHAPQGAAGERPEDPRSVR